MEFLETYMEGFNWCCYMAYILVFHFLYSNMTMVGIYRMSMFLQSAYEFCFQNG
uniref:Uncharacterized protein n=1 Tax=Rhizophora mucronata TaxID=61149 RepID=A0A2P2P9M3_RHIMU